MVRFRKKAVFWIFVVFLVGFSSAGSNIMKIWEAEGGQKRPRNLLKYNTQQAQKNASDAYTDGSDAFVPYDLRIVLEAVEKLNDTQCSQDALTVLEAISKRERWALQMFDASSKFPVGLLYGNFYQMGNFDECVGLKQPEAVPGYVPIQGQYCLADVELFNKKKYDGRTARSFETVKDKHRHVFNNTMYWSICAPSSCTVDEIKIIVKEIFSLAIDLQGVTVRLTENRCHVEEVRPFSALEIAYGSIIGIFFVFVIIATAFHYYILQEKKQSPESSIPKQALLCFSLIQTTGKFLTTKSSSLNLECICGIKALSMAFIVVGHTFLFVVGGPVENTNFYDQESRSFVNAIFVNSPLLVDTFLLISGFLMCYLLLIELDKRKGRINVLVLYIGRYIRLTPSYLVVIGFYCTFLYRVSNGPLWDSRIKMEQERCQKSWWTNILYVNNYVNTDNMCMFQSWYLAADYHLFIIAPLVIYPLWKLPKIGQSILGAGLFVSVIVPFIVTLKDKLDPTLMIFAPEVYDISENFYFKEAYVKTHMRAGSYFFGLFLGYLLYKLQTKGTKIPRYVIWFGWFICATCGIISMYSVIIFYYPDHVYNPLESAAYASMHRLAWCTSIGWIVLVCVTKNATLVNKFLAWKPFIPLSRLTYCAYLCNGFVELYSFGSVRRGNYMSKLEMGTKSLAHLVLTFAFAFALCILFESPIHGLEKILLRRGTAARNIDRNGNSDQRDNSRV